MIPPPIFQFAPKPIKPVAIEEQEEEIVDGDDYFDLLPEPIVLDILNRLVDAKSLCRCVAVSKRFASLVPEVDSAFVVAKPRLSSIYPAVPKKSSSRSFLKSLFAKLLLPNRKADSKLNFIGPGELSQWICNSIKNFTGIRDLRIELPDNGGIVGFPDTGGFLKWSAEFGKQFERCAVIGATAFEKPSDGEIVVSDPSAGTDSNPNPDQNQIHNQPSLSEEALKSRVVWILSCLVSACARHGVVRKSMLDCPDLRSAVILDARKQGRLSMNEKQIKELRESINSSAEETVDPIWKRTTVPNVIVKVWYAPQLVLPRSGYVVKGATVVVVRPETDRREDGGASEKDCELFNGGFGGEEEEEEVIAEAIRETLKSKCKLMYKLEMNSL